MQRNSIKDWLKLRVTILSIHILMLGSGTTFELLLGESSLLGGRIVRADL